MYKGFEGRDMLLEHIPYISRTYPVDLPFISRKAEFSTEEQVFRHNNKRTNNYYRQKNKRTKCLDDKYVFLLETLRASSHVPSNQTYLCFTKQSSS